MNTAPRKPGMLDTMLHVIRGMKDHDKLSKLLGATVARCAIINGYEQTARELEALAGEVRRQAPGELGAGTHCPHGKPYSMRCDQLDCR